MNRLLTAMGTALGFGRRAARLEQDEALCAVFARIEDPLMPLERGHKYEAPLNRALQQAGLGRVSGAGSVQGLDGTIEWVSLDLQLADLDAALEFTRERLRDLGAPRGSVLKFNKGSGIATIPIG